MVRPANWPGGDACYEAVKAILRRRFLQPVEEPAIDNEPPDNRGPAIVVTGGAIGGFTFTGPFDSIDAAAMSLHGILKANVTIALLEEPREMERRAQP
jgi:hypothetical protein